ncbi:MAG: T9SS type A sorting domain-containing protein [Saprospiraceae bacterium]
MRYLILLIITITYLQLSAQRYYSKTYDPYNHQEENIRNLIASDSMLYLSCRGGCEGNTIECFKYARVDIEGNYIDGYEDTRFETGYGMETDGEWIYVDGGNESKFTSLFANKISLLGDTNTLLELQLDPLTQNWFNNISSISTEEAFITYGGFYDLTDSIYSKSKFKGIINWYNKETFVLDTTIVLNPYYGNQVVFDAKVDKNNNVYFALQERIPNIIGNILSHIRIIKMDNKGNILWDYIHEDSYNTKLLINLQIIGDKIIFTQKDSEYLEKEHIVCIDILGNTQWKYYFDDDYKKKIHVLRMIESKDGSLIIAGFQRSGFHGWSDVGFMSKFTLDGKLLWERIFEVDKGLDPYYNSIFEDRPLSKAGAFWSVKELENGDLVAVGELRKGYDDPESGLRSDQDLWIVKTDSMGCLVPGCGLVQKIQNGVVVVDTCKYLKEQAEWYYTPWSETGIATLSKVEIIGDTLIGNQLCSILGVIEDDELIEGSVLVIFYNWASEHVYFYEDEQFKILYDFSLGVLPGDTLEFYLPQNYMFYDISSTEGSFTPSKESYRHRIIDIPYINLPDGTQLRVIETQLIPNDSGECFEMREILTGIGSKSGFLGRPCVQIPSGFSEYFRCYKSDDFEYSEVGGSCELNQKNLLVDEDNTWTYIVVNSDSSLYSISYKFSKDTFEYNGNYYRELQYLLEENGNEHLLDRYYREENGKIYQSNISSFENIAYDFTLSLNDTFKIRGFSPESYFKVVGIDSITLLNQEKRKRLELRCLDDLEAQFTTPVIWIEGIGGTSGLISTEVACGSLFDSDILCFKHNDEILISNEKYDRCWIVSSNNTIKTKSIYFTPNPTYNHLFIEGVFNAETPYTIYSTTGKVVKRGEVVDGVIDVYDLLASIYILSIHINKEIINAKFVKM